jgi:hypothetical protein
MAQQFDLHIIARQHAVGGQGKGFQQAFRAQSGEQMRRGPPFMVTPLRADVVKPPACGYVHFHHLGKSGGGGAAFQQGQFRARAAYSYVGEAFTSVSATDLTGTTDRFDAALGTIDLQARYTINDRFEIIGEVRNATNEEKINYTGNDIYRDVSFYGRQFWLGTTFKF